MRNSQLAILCSLAVSSSSCKTVARDNDLSTTSEISIRLPGEIKGQEALVIFNRMDRVTTPFQLRGRDLKIKLSSGTYSIDMVIYGPDGAIEYTSCDSGRAYVFVQPKENALVDICKSGENTIIQGEDHTAVPATPLPPAVEVPLPRPGPLPLPLPMDTAPGKPMPMPQVPLPTPPLMPMPPKISISDSCFGQVVTGYVENSDIILKPEGIINNRIIELTKYPNCSVTLDIDKPIGKIYVPFAYKLTFQGDADFYSKNFWFTAEGQDANGIRVQPCEGFVFNAATNSQKPFVCSYYDKAPEGSRVVPPKNQPFFDKSCAAASTKLKFNFSIGGPSRAVINNLVISELRIQLPTIESCP